MRLAPDQQPLRRLVGGLPGAEELVRDSGVPRYEEAVGTVVRPAADCDSISI